MFTLHDLDNVFNPSDDDDDDASPPGGTESPKQSIQRIRQWARESVMRTVAQDEFMYSSQEEDVMEEEEADAVADADADSADEDADAEEQHIEIEDDDDDDREQQYSNKRQKVVAVADASTSRQQPRCFLCDYCTSNEVRFVTSFIADNIANMDVGYMAEQIRKYIFEKRPEYSEGNHGLEIASIRKHISHHMLSPTVRIADMMRHLLSLCSTLRNNLEKVDPDTGESMADRTNIDTYLKVVTKVLDMYKMSETNKMLFANTEK
jgi:hypothetical protein